MNYRFTFTPEDFARRIAECTVLVEKKTGKILRHQWTANNAVFLSETINFVDGQIQGYIFRDPPDFRYQHNLAVLTSLPIGEKIVQVFKDETSHNHSFMNVFEKNDNGFYVRKLYYKLNKETAKVTPVWVLVWSRDEEDAIEKQNHDCKYRLLEAEKITDEAERRIAFAKALIVEPTLPQL